MRVIERASAFVRCGQHPKLKSRFLIEGCYMSGDVVELSAARASTQQGRDVGRSYRRTGKRALAERVLLARHVYTCYKRPAQKDKKTCVYTCRKRPARQNKCHCARFSHHKPLTRLCPRVVHPHAQAPASPARCGVKQAACPLVSLS